MTITDAQRATAARVALAQVGKPYLFGKNGPDTFDCSGLVQYAWEQAGVTLPHNSVLQAQVLDNPFVTLVPYVQPNIARMKLGDILFFYADWHHCGIFTDIQQPGSWDRLVQATDPQHGVEHLRFAQYVAPIAIGWMGHH